ncbi:hypothetical protein GQ42DRAFT_15070 [Ramicandelaber brevisporus]|nr:hypothetical protein GQ42DRAFT_15070 [Ramicandelaber brevisporus]
MSNLTKIKPGSSQEPRAATTFLPEHVDLFRSAESTVATLRKEAAGSKSPYGKLVTAFDLLKSVVVPTQSTSSSATAKATPVAPAAPAGWKTQSATIQNVQRAITQFANDSNVSDGDSNAVAARQVLVGCLAPVAIHLVLDGVDITARRHCISLLRACIAAHDRLHPSSNSEHSVTNVVTAMFGTSVTDYLTGSGRYSHVSLLQRSLCLFVLIELDVGLSVLIPIRGELLNVFAKQIAESISRCTETDPSTENNGTLASMVLAECQDAVRNALKTAMSILVKLPPPIVPGTSDSDSGVGHVNLLDKIDDLRSVLLSCLRVLSSPDSFPVDVMQYAGMLLATLSGFANCPACVSSSFADTIFAEDSDAARKSVENVFGITSSTAESQQISRMLIECRNSPASLICVTRGLACTLSPSILLQPVGEGVNCCSHRRSHTQQQQQQQQQHSLQRKSSGLRRQSSLGHRLLSDDTTHLSVVTTLSTSSSTASLSSIGGGDGTTLLSSLFGAIDILLKGNHPSFLRSLVFESLANWLDLARTLLSHSSPAVETVPPAGIESLRILCAEFTASASVSTPISDGAGAGGSSAGVGSAGGRLLSVSPVPTSPSPFEMHPPLETDRLTEVLGYVWDNWDDAVEIVQHKVRAVFCAVLSLGAELATDSIGRARFIASVSRRVLSLSWAHRAKYSLLATLLPYVAGSHVDIIAECTIDNDAVSKACRGSPAAALLALDNTLLSGLFAHMRTAVMAHRGAELLRAMLAIPDNTEEAELAESWRNVWVESIAQSVTRDVSTGHCKWIPQIIVPQLLERRPQWIQSIMAAISTFSSSTASEDARTRSLVAVFRVARNKNLADFDENDSSSASVLNADTMIAALDGPDVYLAIEIMAIACDTKRIALLPSQTELSIFYRGIVRHIDCVVPEYRQKLTGWLHNMFTRMQGGLSKLEKERASSSLFLHRFESGTLVTDSGKMPGEETLAKARRTIDTAAFESKRMTAFVQQLAGLCRDGLRPGATFQRTFQCLFILSQMIKFWGTAHSTSTVSENACRVNASIISKELTIALLHVLSDLYEINRQSAYSLLVQVPHPIDGLDSFSQVQQLATDAMDAIGNKREGESIGAATMLRLVFTKFVVELGWPIRLLPTSHSSSVDATNEDVDISSAALVFMSDMLQLVQSRIEVARISLADAAQNAPIHGLIHALRSLIESVNFGSPAVQQRAGEWRKILIKVRQLVADVLGVTMTVLSDQSPEGNLPDSVQQQQQQQQYTNDDIEESTTGYNLAGEGSGRLVHQDVGTYCWRAIKEATALLCTSVTHPPLRRAKADKDQVYFIETVDVIAAGDTLRSALLSLRHRGAFAAVHPMFAEICRFMMSQPREQYGNELATVPAQWLEECLASLADSDVSITRRSAGVPLYVLAILSSESRSRRTLVPAAMERLLAYAATPVDQYEAQQLQQQQSQQDLLLAPADTKPSTSPFGPATKSTSPSPVPQGSTTKTGSGAERTKAALLLTSASMTVVHATNILRTLFLDQNLGNDVLPYAGRAFELAIRGHSAATWAVRNCSTMLFTALLIRVFGAVVSRLEGEFMSQSGIASDTSDAAASAPVQTDAEHKVHGLTSRVFFSRFPSMREFLLTDLRSSVEASSLSVSKSLTVSLRPQLYPILALLSRLRPSLFDTNTSASDSTDQTRRAGDWSTAPFIPLLAACTANPVLAVRESAARSLAHLIDPHQVMPYIISTLESMSSVANAHNALHGKWLSVLALTKTHLQYAVNDAHVLGVDNLRRAGEACLNVLRTVAANDRCPSTIASCLVASTALAKVLHHASKSSDGKSLGCTAQQLGEAIIQLALAVSGDGLVDERLFADVGVTAMRDAAVHALIVLLPLGLSSASAGFNSTAAVICSISDGLNADVLANAFEQLSGMIRNGINWTDDELSSLLRLAIRKLTQLGILQTIDDDTDTYFPPLGAAALDLVCAIIQRNSSSIMQLLSNIGESLEHLWEITEYLAPLESSYALVASTTTCVASKQHPGMVEAPKERDAFVHVPLMVRVEAVILRGVLITQILSSPAAISAQKTAKWIELWASELLLMSNEEVCLPMREAAAESISIAMSHLVSILGGNTTPSAVRHLYSAMARLLLDDDEDIRDVLANVLHSIRQSVPRVLPMTAITTGLIYQLATLLIDIRMSANSTAVGLDSTLVMIMLDRMAESAVSDIVSSSHQLIGMQIAGEFETEGTNVLFKRERRNIYKDDLEEIRCCHQLLNAYLATQTTLSSLSTELATELARYATQSATTLQTVLKHVERIGGSTNKSALLGEPWSISPIVHVELCRAILLAQVVKMIDSSAINSEALISMVSAISQFGLHPHFETISRI